MHYFKGKLSKLYLKTDIASPNNLVISTRVIKKSLLILVLTNFPRSSITEISLFILEFNLRVVV